MQITTNDFDTSLAGVRGALGNLCDRCLCPPPDEDATSARGRSRNAPCRGAAALSSARSTGGSQVLVSNQSHGDVDRVSSTWSMIGGSRW